MKKTIGWRYRLSNESLKSAMDLYGGFDFLPKSKSKRDVYKEIAEAIREGLIPKIAKPIIFKVTIEDCEK